MIVSWFCTREPSVHEREANKCSTIFRLFENHQNNERKINKMCDMFVTNSPRRYKMCDIFVTNSPRSQLKENILNEKRCLALRKTSNDLFLMFPNMIYLVLSNCTHIIFKNKRISRAFFDSRQLQFAWPSFTTSSNR